MNYFFKDTYNHKTFTWSHLVDDINKTSLINPFCKSDDYYTIFKKIIYSLLVDSEIILLDSDLTDEELIKMTGFSNFSEFDRKIDKSKFEPIIDKDDLLKRLKSVSKEWKVTLFSSGTTGNPKKVIHSLDSITRFVKVSEKNTTDIWGLAYNPTHIAGLQVFFQALLNGNYMIRLFDIESDRVHEEIVINKITHISATPTFFRLINNVKNVFPNILRVSSGGEKLDQKTMENLNKTFPNAKINNIYASTEFGSLFASHNDIFTVHPNFERFVCIQENELLIHNSMMGKFDDRICEWFKTGDIVEVVSDIPLKFRFVNRIGDVVNIGGYSVNLLEVEKCISELPNIEAVRVFQKKSSLVGNLLCCEIVTNNSQIDESSIRESLKSKIQDFKIPRMIYFTQKLTTTRTGKTKRV